MKSLVFLTVVVLWVSETADVRSQANMSLQPSPGFVVTAERDTARGDVQVNNLTGDVFVFFDRTKKLSLPDFSFAKNEVGEFQVHEFAEVSHLPGKTSGKPQIHFRLLKNVGSGDELTVFADVLELWPELDQKRYDFFSYQGSFPIRIDDTIEPILGKKDASREMLGEHKTWRQIYFAALGVGIAVMSYGVVKGLAPKDRGTLFEINLPFATGLGIVAASLIPRRVSEKRLDRSIEAYLAN